MGIQAAILLVVVLLIAALAALNWGLIASPVLMSIGFMQVNAPLGLFMLGLTVLLAILAVAYVVYLQSSILFESRRQGKELQAQRDLADRAEASRFTELRSFLETQENAHMARNAERHAALLARVEQFEGGLRVRMDESERSLAAHIGQLEDRLDRHGVPVAASSGVMPPAV